MAQKVDHSALWMYAPNAGGKGVPTYFKPTERDGATVGKHPGPWLVGGGLTNMLLTPHEGEGSIDVSFWPDGQDDPLFWARPGGEDEVVEVLNGTEYPSRFLVVFTPPTSEVAVECGCNGRSMLGEFWRVPARIPGWSGELYVEPDDYYSAWDAPIFVPYPQEYAFAVHITGYGEDPLPSNPRIEFELPAGFFYVGDKTSDEIVISVPLTPGEA